MLVRDWRQVRLNQCDVPWMKRHSGGTSDWTERIARHLDRSALSTARQDVDEIMPRPSMTPPYRLAVLPRRAAASSWYICFPRSLGVARGLGEGSPLLRAQKLVDYIAELGFTVLLLCPVHPVGHTGRKGVGGAPGAIDGPGSPWSVGNAYGGHYTLDPALGTVEEFSELLAYASRAGVAIAMDIPVQSSFDHPYLSEHPEWPSRDAAGDVASFEYPGGSVYETLPHLT